MSHLIDAFLQLSNHHIWYTFQSPDDWFRSAMWLSANLITAISYFMIPWEIWYWKNAFPFRFSTIISLAFMGFIFFCGAHHVVDAMIMLTAPWWAICTVNVPMAIFSVMTAFYLRKHRTRIIEALEVFVIVLKNLDVVKIKGK